MLCLCATHVLSTAQPLEEDSIALCGGVATKLRHCSAFHRLQPRVLPVTDKIELVLPRFRRRRWRLRGRPALVGRVVVDEGFPTYPMSSATLPYALTVEFLSQSI
jgi:hypothetical protein